MQAFRSSSAPGNKKMIEHMRRDCLNQMRFVRRETNILAALFVIPGFLAGGSSPVGASALRFKADGLPDPASDGAGSPWVFTITT